MITPGEISARDFGALEVKVALLAKQLEDHQKESKAALVAATDKIDELLALANKGKGAYWAGMLMAGGIGASIAAIAKLVFTR